MPGNEATPRKVHRLYDVPDHFGVWESTKTGKLWEFRDGAWGFWTDKPGSGWSTDDEYCSEHDASGPFILTAWPPNTLIGQVISPAVDMVNHPPHYTRGPDIDMSGPAGLDPGTIGRTIECIEVIRHITDMRLATAMKYIWRVAFGGKGNDREDIEKAIWYLRDWLDNPT